MIYLEKVENLKKLIDIRKNGVVSVSGSGGKTIFCLTLCEELKEEAQENERIFFTTTTKILPVDRKYGFYDMTFTGTRNIQEILSEAKDKSGVAVLGTRKNGKIVSLKREEISELRKICSYMIIECDGSKMKPLKGWNETEPVYVKETTKSVGIIPVNIIGEEVREEIVHRIELFQEISGIGAGELITVETLCNIILHEKGLFKDSINERILLLNCMEREKDRKNVIEIAKNLWKKGSNLKITAASLKNKEYYLLKGRN